MRYVGIERGTSTNGDMIMDKVSDYVNDRFFINDDEDAENATRMNYL